jgi:hypothetical protein
MSFRINDHDGHRRQHLGQIGRRGNGVESLTKVEAELLKQWVPPAVGPTYLYYRVELSSNPGATVGYARIAHIEMAEYIGGPDFALLPGNPGNIATAQNNSTTRTPDKAIDGVIGAEGANMWQGLPGDVWWQVQLPAPKALAELKHSWGSGEWAPINYPNAGEWSLRVLGSNNGVDWTDISGWLLMGAGTTELATYTW